MGSQRWSVLVRGCTEIMRRMASSFELGCEQPQIYKQRAQNLAASSYQNLFGSPPTRSRPLAKKVIPPTKKDTRTRKQKPLPVNPLTGDIIGLPPHLQTAATMQQNRTVAGKVSG